MKIKDYYKYCKDNNLNVLGVLEDSPDSFEEFYNMNASDVDLTMCNTLSECIFMFDEDDTDTISSLIHASYVVNKWQIEKLWEIAASEYNPLWNVDGDTITTSNYSEKETRDEFGQAITRSAMGERKGKDVTESERTSYESDAYNKDVKTTSNTTTESVTDSTTRDSYTDIHKDGAHTVTVTERRQGNIGVTETTTLLKHQQEFVVKFNAVKSIFTIIMADACELYFDD